MATIDEVKQFLDECGLYILATEMDGQPYARPFGAHTIFEGKLYFQTGKVKEVAAQLEKNPRVEICASKPTAWLRLRGQLVEDPRIEAQGLFWRPIPVSELCTHRAMAIPASSIWTTLRRVSSRLQMNRESSASRFSRLTAVRDTLSLTSCSKRWYSRWV